MPQSELTHGDSMKEMAKEITGTPVKRLVGVIVGAFLSAIILFGGVAGADLSSDPYLRNLIVSMFDGSGYVKVAIMSGITNPLPVTATIAAAPKLLNCALGTAPVCMTVTSTEEEIVLPASADSSYLITVQETEGGTNAVNVDCITGADPEAVYGTTGQRLPAGFVGYLYASDAKLSCDSGVAGKTLYVCASACTR